MEFLILILHPNNLNRAWNCVQSNVYLYCPGNEFVHENTNINLRNGDVVNYWVFVLQQGSPFHLFDQQWIAQGMWIFIELVRLSVWWSMQESVTVNLIDRPIYDLSNNRSDNQSNEQCKNWRSSIRLPAHSNNRSDNRLNNQSVNDNNYNRSINQFSNQSDTFKMIYNSYRNCMFQQSW